MPQNFVRDLLVFMAQYVTDPGDVRPGDFRVPRPSGPKDDRAHSSRLQILRDKSAGPTQSVAANAAQSRAATRLLPERRARGDADAPFVRLIVRVLKQ
jgi:hypothetical protein